MSQPTPAADIAAVHQQIRQALAAGDLSAAQSGFEALVALRPRDPGAWLNLAGLRRQRNDLDAAMAAVRRALEIEPRDSTHLASVEVQAQVHVQMAHDDLVGTRVAVSIHGSGSLVVRGRATAKDGREHQMRREEGAQGGE